MNEVRVAVAGVGNCASCLVQGSEMLRDELLNVGEAAPAGLLTPDVSGYGPGSVKVVVGFDVSEEKIQKDLSQAIWEEPNCAQRFYGPNWMNAPVLPGPLFDGLGRSAMEMVNVSRRVNAQEVQEALDAYEVDVLVNFLPVGSEEATEFYAQAALDAGVGFVNAIPVFIARKDSWRRRFAEKRVPLIGDDVKSQVGATILHRALAEAFESRGAKIEMTYQENLGGNLDFANMQDGERLASKRESKTGSVRAVADVPEEQVHIGPAGYLPFLKDEKVAYIRIEGTGFLGNRLSVETRYSGQDSPNSAAVVYDAVRYAKAAMDSPEDVSREFWTAPASAWLMKAPGWGGDGAEDTSAADRCREIATWDPKTAEMEEVDLGNGKVPHIRAISAQMMGTVSP